MKGWLKMHRKIIDSKVFVNPELLKLWLLCLCKATHKKAWVDIDGISAPIELNPGQFITGRYVLHKEFYPNRSKHDKSPLTVWRKLKSLEEWGMLNIISHGKYSLVEIQNWELYQSKGTDSKHDEHQVNNIRTSSGYQLSTNKNEQKLNKNDKELSSILTRDLPSVRKMDRPMTQDEEERLVSQYGKQAVREVLMDMENWKPLRNKNKSAYLTALKWLSKKGHDNTEKEFDPELARQMRMAKHGS